MKRGILLLVLALWVSPGLGAGPEELLSAYAAMAGQADPGFAGFSADRGKAFYFSGHRIEDGSELSCASCHHEDPRREQFAHHDKIPCRACHGMPDNRQFRRHPQDQAPVPAAGAFCELATLHRRMVRREMVPQELRTAAQTRLHATGKRRRDHLAADSSNRRAPTFGVFAAGSGGAANPRRRQPSWPMRRRVSMLRSGDARGIGKCRSLRARRFPRAAGAASDRASGC